MHDDDWYWSRDAVTHGPITRKALKQQGRSGRLRPDDLVYHREATGDWVMADQMEGLLRPAGQPPPLPPSDSASLRFTDGFEERMDWCDEYLRKTARRPIITMSVIAGIYFLSSLVYFAPYFSPAAPQPEAPIVILGSGFLVLGFAFAGLAVWAAHEPGQPSLAGLIVFVVTEVIGLILFPLALLSLCGWTVRAVVVANLLAGLSAARAYKRRAERLEERRKCRFRE